MHKAYIKLFDPTQPHAFQAALPPTKPLKGGTTRILFDQPQGVGALTVLASLGEGFHQKAPLEQREQVRQAVGNAVSSVKSLASGVGEAELDLSLEDGKSVDPHAAAVATHLSWYKFTLKTSPKTVPEKPIVNPSQPSKEWDTGVIYAEAQNLARTLKELPGNMCTPTAFTDRVKSEFANVPDVEIRVHDEAWAAEKHMRTFLSVTKGSSEPAKFLEIIYKGDPSDAQPIAFVGKGITFDSGGISLKSRANMKAMRGDMGGAAVVVSATLAIARLRLPINLITVVPLSENMPGPSAMKPGDIIYAMNGKSVEVDNTDAEGRLVLSDAIYYAATEFKPHTLIDVATLTGAIDVALGEVFSGVFTDSDALWKELHEAGQAEYDRFWRMPLDDDYLPQISNSNADLCNTGGRAAGSCTAAIFLKAFLPQKKEGKADAPPPLRWAHIDMAGSSEATRSGAYQMKGMTGRPVRALIEWASRFGH